MSRPEMVESLPGDQLVIPISRDQRVGSLPRDQRGVSAQRSECGVTAKRSEGKDSALILEGVVTLQAGSARVANQSQNLRSLHRPERVGLLP